MKIEALNIPTCFMCDSPLGHDACKIQTNSGREFHLCGKHRDKVVEILEAEGAKQAAKNEPESVELNKEELQKLAQVAEMDKQRRNNGSPVKEGKGGIVKIA